MTSFANPAVTIARALSDTFAGIAPAGVTAFIVAQLIGATVGMLLARWFDNKARMSAIGTKRTSACALHMSAFDPKRTLVGLLTADIGLQCRSTAAVLGGSRRRKPVALVVEFVLLAIPNNLNHHVLAPWTLNGAPIVPRPVRLDASEPHVGVT